MFFSLKRKKKKIEIYSLPFCETLCALLIPHLHQGQTVFQAWDEIKWLIDHDQVREIFEEGLLKGFSTSFITHVEETYEDYFTGHLVPMLYIFSELGDENPRATADALTVLQLKGRLRPNSHYTTRWPTRELLTYFQKKFTDKK